MVEEERIKHSIYLHIRSSLARLRSASYEKREVIVEDSRYQTAHFLYGLVSSSV